MPSRAASNFILAIERADVLATTARDNRLRPIKREISRVYLHASLALYVATWDAYVKRLVLEFYDEISDPNDARFSIVSMLLRNQHDIAQRKLNAPNADNARNFLLSYTGYDPINDWIWPEIAMSGLEVRQRLNDILKVRHAFAHGFSMPSFAWNTSQRGEVRLTAEIVRLQRSFFLNLVRRTDEGMAQYLRQNFNPAINW